MTLVKYTSKCLDVLKNEKEDKTVRGTLSLGDLRFEKEDSVVVKQTVLKAINQYLKKSKKEDLKSFCDINFEAELYRESNSYLYLNFSHDPF